MARIAVYLRDELIEADCLHSLSILRDFLGCIRGLLFQGFLFFILLAFEAVSGGVPLPAAIVARHIRVVRFSCCVRILWSSLVRPLLTPPGFIAAGRSG